MIQGATPGERFKEIDGSEALILLGYHARALTPSGVLAHTYSSASIQRMRLNGRDVGEIGVDAAIAAERGVPVVLVIGDDKTLAEAAEWVPGALGCETKSRPSGPPGEGGRPATPGGSPSAMLVPMHLPRVVVRLKAGREHSALHRHPWIFSGAIADVVGPPAEPLAVADVVSAEGAWVAGGVYHAGANLAVRLYSWAESEPVGPELLARRIEKACRRRREALRTVPMPDTDAFRLVHSEADGVSGLIVDQYADALSVRVTALAIGVWIDPVLDALQVATGVAVRSVRADPDAVEREGLDGDAIASRSRGPTVARFREHGAVFEADLASGQKTGFFLDQRENRRRTAAWACGRRMLSAYCYTGAFEVHAARAGATEIVGLDVSEPALAAARRHHQMNGTSVANDYQKADVPAALRRFRDERRTFDLIVLDPPRFVFTRAGRERGLRAYKDINLLAMKLLAPGGVLATFSCSGLVSWDEFSAMARWAAVDAGRDVRVIERLGQPFDHPTLLTFPESEYLKGLLCQVD